MIYNYYLTVLTENASYASGFFAVYFPLPMSLVKCVVILKEILKILHENKTHYLSSICRKAPNDCCKKLKNYAYFFSLLISRIRRPLKSRHASRFVVFSICAPIDRSIEPNPSHMYIMPPCITR